MQTIPVLVNVRYNLNETRAARARRYTVRVGASPMRGTVLERSAKEFTLEFHWICIARGVMAKVAKSGRRQVGASIGGYRVMTKPNEVLPGLRKIGYLPFSLETIEAFFWHDQIPREHQDEYAHCTKHRRFGSAGLIKSILAADIREREPTIVHFNQHGVAGQ